MTKSSDQMAVPESSAVVTSSTPPSPLISHQSVNRQYHFTDSENDILARYASITRPTDRGDTSSPAVDQARYIEDVLILTRHQANEYQITHHHQPLPTIAMLTEVYEIAGIASGPFSAEQLAVRFNDSITAALPAPSRVAPGMFTGHLAEEERGEFQLRHFARTNQHAGREIS